MIPSKAKQDALTRQKLVELLTYDPESGEFTWNAGVRSANAGRPAGTTNFHGYVVIGIARRYYMAHRLAWLITYGEWPTFQIDHIDGLRNNNRIRNLRQADDRLNRENMRSAQRNSSTGLLGAHRSRRKFVARIQVAGRIEGLGTFETPEAAHAAYVAAKRRLHHGGTL